MSLLAVYAINKEKMIKKFYALLMLSLLSMPLCSSAHLPDKPIYFVIIIPSYNNKAWYQKNLDSVLSQKYSHYHVIYMNDNSTDGTGDLVAAYLREKDKDRKVFFIDNNQRVGALANIYRAVQFSQDNQVMVLLDGDDWLAHENVLSKLATTYENNKNWLVYSQFMQLPMNEHGWNRVFAKSEYQSPHISRNYSPSHLRTFYAGLFKKIKLDDLKHEGEFYSMTWDMAIMLPMVEMASEGHVHFIPEVMYMYNHANPISDHCVDGDLQRNFSSIIATKKKYAPIKQLF